MDKHIHVINEEKISKIDLINDEKVNDISSLFKMFSDSTRVKIILVLANCELNVCEIAHLLDMTHSAISHQLATLKMTNLVKSRKSGKEVYYSLADEHISSIIAIGKQHVMEE